MKLRKSLVRPVVRQKTCNYISSCAVLPPEIVMHNTFNVILLTSADICVVHDISGGRTKQHVIIGFGELAAVD